MILFSNSATDQRGIWAMNMQTSFEGELATHSSLASAHDLLVVALQIIDELELPAQIGAQLDHSIQTLRKYLGADHSPVTFELLA